jgi:hypothetical protein
MDCKTSRQSSTSSNNLLKPDINIWGTNINDVELLKNKSQSLSNIAGKLKLKLKTKFSFFFIQKLF